jgi:spermidine synthase
LGSDRLARIIFLFLFFSGACSLTYQIIWTRLAYAQFGIITPVLSVVISVFMLGLSLGSWLAGRHIESWTKQSGLSAIFFYGLAESLIAVGAHVVPYLFKLGSSLLLNTGELNSTWNLLLSALVIAVVVLPWCICMGATLPLVLAFTKEIKLFPQGGAVSLLYAANVLGAIFGTLLTTFLLIELFGFSGVLAMAAIANFCIGAIAFLLMKTKALPVDLDKPSTSLIEAESELTQSSVPGGKAAHLALIVLFSTGFISMAMEVVWTRAFFCVLGNEVYSFAGILLSYLVATFFGSFLYRYDLITHRVLSTNSLLLRGTFFAFLPIFLNDPRVHFFFDALGYFVTGQALNMLLICKIVNVAVALLSIVPFCLTLGYLTPKLIEEHSKDDPNLAGTAYAFNVLGCIFGPLLAAYIILPKIGAKDALSMLAVLFALLAVYAHRHQPLTKKGLVFGTFFLFYLVAQFLCFGYEELLAAIYPRHEIKKDYAATSVAVGEGKTSQLIVNGVGVTSLDQSPKMMAHFPLTLLKRPPHDCLTICFGMGTTFRSLLTWDTTVTAVELVPGVRDLFGFFHKDAPEVMKNPRGSVVIDDGRRYLHRTNRTFDLITIDPPPPSYAAGLSLLLSEEFFQLAKAHLKPGGLLQEFYPYNDPWLIAGILRSCSNTFRYVQVYDVPGKCYYMLASDEPITKPDLTEAVAKMPEAAKRDMLEWRDRENLSRDPHQILEQLYNLELPLEKLMNPDPNLKITDDKPVNEYFLLKKLMAH